MRTEQVIKQFGEMMISRMERLKDKTWKKGWIGTEFNGMPMNLTGREYSGMNSMMLFMVSDLKGYKCPVFLTFHQLKEHGGSVKKGEKSVPVLFWSIVRRDKDGVAISEEEWDNLSDNGRRECNTYPVLRSYNVFNIEQTDLEKVAPKVIEKLKEKYGVGEIPTDTEGMYVSTSLDDMITNNTWVCPIQSDKASNHAFYSKKEDKITLPLKSQFKKGNTEEEVFHSGQEFYSTMLHEMAHSTGHPTRLNRLEKDAFGDKSYGKEELVAELTAALVGQRLGFDSRILDNNACYLDGWIKTIKKDPKFIVSVLAEVNKASAMISEKLNS